MRALAIDMTIKRSIGVAEKWHAALTQLVKEHQGELVSGGSVPVPWRDIRPFECTAEPDDNTRGLLMKSLFANGFILGRDDTLTFHGLHAPVIPAPRPFPLHCWCGASTIYDDYSGTAYCLSHQCAGTVLTTLPHAGSIDVGGVWYCKRCAHQQAQGGQKRARVEEEESMSETPAEPPAKRHRFSVKLGDPCPWRKQKDAPMCGKPCTVAKGQNKTAHCTAHQCTVILANGTRCLRMLHRGGKRCMTCYVDQRKAKTAAAQ